MTNLSELAKKLQEQVDVITTYLAKEKLPSPSFIPSGDSMKTSMDSLPPDVEAARQAAIGLSWNLNALLTTPQAQIQGIHTEFWRSVSLRIIIENEIPFMIPVSSSGVPLAEISHKAGLREDQLIHVFRQLTAINVFREPEPRVFAHTSASAVFVHPQYANRIDLIRHHLDEQFKGAGYLHEALTLYGSEYDNVDKAGLRTPFNLAFHTEEHFFDWLYSPANFEIRGARFGRGMASISSADVIGPYFGSYDWTTFQDGEKIVDVGGGVGEIGAWIRSKVKPEVEIIVQDRPTVVEQGESIHGNLVSFQAHDFFAPQPVVGAKLYYLRHILHDWPDSICRTILAHLHRAMDSNSRILVIERIWKDDAYFASGHDDQHLIDAWPKSELYRSTPLNLLMLTCLGSKERSEKEWHELLGSAGFKIIDIKSRGTPESLIEAIKQ